MLTAQETMVLLAGWGLSQMFQIQPLVFGEKELSLLQRVLHEWSRDRTRETDTRLACKADQRLRLQQLETQDG